MRSILINAFTVVLTVSGLAAVWMLGQAVIFHDPPARVQAVISATPSAARGALVVIKVAEHLTVPSDCIGTTLYFFQYADGAFSKAPGYRTIVPGRPAFVTYEANVPLAAHVGHAKFFARDFFPCQVPGPGGARSIDTPLIPIEILP